MSKITLPSGFIFDYENLYGVNKVTEEDILHYEDQWKAALAASHELVKSGTVDGHLSKDGEQELVLFPQLPHIQKDTINNPIVIRKLDELKDYSQREVDLVVSFGIGGSYLGDKVIFDMHCGEFWNSLSPEERDHYPQLLFSGNNVDPQRTYDLIRYIEREAKKKQDFKILLVLISKSGSTIEPMSNFMIVTKALEEHGLSYEVVAVTDPHEGEKETLLHKLAVQEGWTLFSVPNGVGGRFSVFTEVGLVVGALIGFDYKAFLQGAEEMDAFCRKGELFSNPALLNALLKYISGVKYGRIMEVFMPYGDYLKSTSEWYVQLLAESLGKKVRRNGEEDPYGRTPIVAVGTTDMHAQTQEHQEGPYDKIVTFLQITHWPHDLTVPHTYDSYEKLKAFSGLTLSSILNAAKEANEDALTSDNRFNCSFILPELSPYHMGELLFLLCWSIFYEGELASVDAFNQPGVEVYKKLLGPKLKELKGE